MDPRHPTGGVAASDIRWIIAQATERSPAQRLICFPFAGGGERIFAGWGAAIGAGTQVCAVRLPGRDSRIAEAPATSMSAIVGPIVDAIASRGDVPFALFGHSMGAYIALEVARTLRRASLPTPVHLVVSAAAPPTRRRERRYHRLPDRELAEVLLEMGGTSKEVIASRELMELFVPVIRADFELCETHHFTAGPALDCPITAFGGGKDEQVDVELLDAWREQTTARFAMHVFDGGHLFLETCRAKVLDTLRKVLPIPPASVVQARK